MKAIIFRTLASVMLAAPAAASAQAPIGSDAQACMTGVGPAVQVNVLGLKDRHGNLKLELYPGNQDDFLKDDRDLRKEGKFFRRVLVPTPQSGSVTMCISAPKPGRYALLFTHDRDGKNKFNFWTDGAGFPSNITLGRSRPKLAMAVIDLGPGVTTTTIHAQYLRGFGFRAD